MKRTAFWKGPLVAVAFFVILITPCLAQQQKQATPARPDLVKRIQAPGAARALAQPDLSVLLAGPDRAIAGRNVTVSVTVKNTGAAAAPGSAGGGARYYYVDLVLSSDTSVPVALAVQPAYAGKTRDDFVEDMLLEGGRISNTQSIPAGGQAKYSLGLYIPKRTPPGLYCLGAVADPAKAIVESNENNNCGCLGIMVAASPIGRVTAPAGAWVMPYAVGGTTLNRINAASGLTNYTDGSGLVMNNAPFGGYLGLRHGYHNSLPSAAIKYYRWLYRRAGEAAWHEFTEPVGVHYVREEAGKQSFPVYWLGPKSVAGKNLYEFRPHSAPAEPGAATSWPVTDWFGDIYSGFLNSPLLDEGVYRVRLEVFSPTGTQVMPAAGAFSFILPLSVAADGTVSTKPAGPAVVGGGCEFALHLDNRSCSAQIDAVRIGSSGADACGFLPYQNPADKVQVAFHATHPGGFAVFGFAIIRGAVTANTASGEVKAPTAGLYQGDGNGNFSHPFAVSALLSPSCSSKAAFSENLHVYAKATTGWGHRIGGYDADAVRAFALAPGMVVSLFVGDCQTTEASGDGAEEGGGQ